MKRYLIRTDLLVERDPNAFTGPYPRYWRSLRQQFDNSTPHRHKGWRYDKRQADYEWVYVRHLWWCSPAYAVFVEEA